VPQGNSKVDGMDVAGPKPKFLSVEELEGGRK